MEGTNVFPHRRRAAPPIDDESRQASDRGAWQHLSGDLEGAHAAYLAAIERDPANATAHNNLGFLLAQQGDIDGAIACYERALDIDPGKSMALANLGLARAMQATSSRRWRRSTRSRPIPARWRGTTWRSCCCAGPARRRRDHAGGGPSMPRHAVDVARHGRRGPGTAGGAEILQRAVTPTPRPPVRGATRRGPLHATGSGSAAEELPGTPAIDPTALSARYHLSLARGARRSRRGARGARTHPKSIPITPPPDDLALHALAESQPANALADLERAVADPSSQRALLPRGGPRSRGRTRSRGSHVTIASNTVASIRTRATISPTASTSIGGELRW
jgi:tetratricopeptide (TPR) repeat protein